MKLVIIEPLGVEQEKLLSMAAEQLPETMTPASQTLKH